MAEPLSQLVNAQELRARFLESSSDALFLSSISTSRYLGTQRAQLMLSNGTRNDSCSACGNLLLPGWTTSFGLAPTRLRSAAKPRDGGEDSRQKSRHLRCGACCRVTKETVTYSLKTRKKGVTPTEKAPSVQPVVQSGPELLPEKSTKTMSSKQRAKARRDREGLQSLMNRSSQNRATPTLNLLDLMRK